LQLILIRSAANLVSTQKPLNVNIFSFRINVVSLCRFVQAPRTAPQVPTQIILIHFLKEPKRFRSVESDYSTAFFLFVNLILTHSLHQHKQ